MALDRDQILALMAESDGSRDLSGLDLSGADLSRMDMRGVKLSRADLSSADLRWTILEGADLHSSVLRRADARWAILRGANLRQADLSRANLGWADITSADLTGADMDGTNLENVNLGDGVVERRVAARDWVLRGMPAEFALPKAGPLTLAGGLLGTLGLVQVWGWLYRRAYFGAFEVLDEKGVVGLSQGANFSAGLLKVVLLALKTLLVSPLIVIALAALLGLLGILTAVLVVAGERVLERVDLSHPQARPGVITALVVMYAVLFFFMIDPATAFARDHWSRALPGDRGLRSVLDLLTSGGLLTKLGFIAVAVAAATLLWIGFRWLCIWLARYELRTEWRLRYPAVQSALLAARQSPVFARSEPLTAQERRRALLSAGGGLLILATLLAGVGRVYALDDMCDGGNMPRVQLYTSRQPTTIPADELICGRLLAETEDAYHVFFPSQTTGDKDWAARQAAVQTVARERVVQVVTASGDDHQCGTCMGKPSGTERVLIDPDEIVVSGEVQEYADPVVLLKVSPGEPIGAVQIQPTTVIIGADGRVTSDRGVIQARVTVSAVGRLSADGTLLEARELTVLPSGSGEVAVGPPPELSVDLTGVPTITISGQGWEPNSQISIGLAPKGQNAPQIPLGTGSFVVDDSGSFAAPITVPPSVETGPQWQVVARDPATEKVATAPWLESPLPTPTPEPTRVQPTQIVEVTPEAAETPDFAATTAAEAEATNTPFPTAIVPGRPGGSFLECDPDEFEPDWPRGFEKEIYVGFSEGSATQSHSFCGPGDIDLAFFRVKKGRWYRVSTSNLAPGVDTVMAVGDLGDSTPCEPPGCWSDDRGPLTYESEIVFQAIADSRAIITVDNRGNNYGTDATYELGVSEFIPTPTPTLTPAPSNTPSVTPTPTKTPLPLVDYCESNDSCRTANVCTLRVGEPMEAVLDRGSDEDWFITEVLLPGARYELTLDPPDEQDYDLQVRRIERQSTNECPILDSSLVGRNRGDSSEFLTWIQNTGESFVVRVFTPYTTVYGDPHHYYYLTLRCVDGCSTPTPSVTPTATATATRTFTPTPTASATATPTDVVTATPPGSDTATPTDTPSGSVGPPGPGTPSATGTPTTALLGRQRF